MWECAICHTHNNDDESFCIECSAAKPKYEDNHCSNPKCKFYNTILQNPTQKYCGKCGSATTFFKKIEDLC